ncbi:hypothetical protein FACS189459_5020 [Bacilli bacterium]|nr:hypothetical protein FACS189459_5020 [Bacilli bacterium]
MNALIFILLLLCFFAIGYTSGNFLYAEIISKKFCKTSLYDVGSKNPGSTNLARQTKSKKIILFAFSLDVLKCYIPILLAAFIYRIIIKNTDLNLYTPCIIYFAAIGALIGHCYPIKYLYTILFKGGFKSPLVVHNHGGRGVACMAGIFLALNPFF